MVQVIKRNGSIVDFNKEKISIAIQKAMLAGIGKVNIKTAEKIATEIEEDVSNVETLSISEIEKMVYSKLIKYKQANVARTYEGYRAVRGYQRQSNTIDQKVIGIVKGNDENIKDDKQNFFSFFNSKKDDEKVTIEAKEEQQEDKQEEKVSQQRFFCFRGICL